jgi:hypothetical protein
MKSQNHGESVIKSEGKRECDCVAFEKMALILGKRVKDA